MGEMFRYLNYSISYIYIYLKVSFNFKIKYLFLSWRSINMGTGELSNIIQIYLNFTINLRTMKMFSKY